MEYRHCRRLVLIVILSTLSRTFASNHLTNKQTSYMSKSSGRNTENAVLKENLNREQTGKFAVFDSKESNGTYRGTTKAIVLNDEDSNDASGDEADIQTAASGFDLASHTLKEIIHKVHRIEQLEESQEKKLDNIFAFLAQLDLALSDIRDQISDLPLDVMQILNAKNIINTAIVSVPVDNERQELRRPRTQSDLQLQQTSSETKTKFGIVPALSESEKLSNVDVSITTTAASVTTTETSPSPAVKYRSSIYHLLRQKETERLQHKDENRRQPHEVVEQQQQQKQQHKQLRNLVRNSPVDQLGSGSSSTRHGHRTYTSPIATGTRRAQRRWLITKFGSREAASTLRSREEKHLSECPKGYDLRYGKSCYYVSPRYSYTFAWEQARAQCTALEGSLLSVETWDEHQFLKTHLKALRKCELAL
ncbi:uncharacterized protein LOC106161599 [Lingula anatina]|uniref:Uncharacterized protein LOC106161599 n=1 Tax=Lingula anatina TaxID=7574 RepID=A0A1S3I6Z9_LINAN|nr:uncharacterized protein LOC106161599 [Lingula anatina]|eukprot:XP_013394055.1 uncharacterized protein LOC106161599 [Lingula anatina]